MPTSGRGFRVSPASPPCTVLSDLLIRANLPAHWLTLASHGAILFAVWKKKAACRFFGLEEIDAGKVSSTVQEKLKLLEDQRSEMIMGCMRHLREMLGSDRFQILEAYVRGPESIKWTTLPSLLTRHMSR